MQMLKPNFIKRVLFLAAALLYGGCSDKSVDSLYNDGIVRNIIYTASITSDSVYTYPANIISASVKDDILSLRISYSGGCKDHNFNLFSLNVFLESNPLQISMRLSHNGNGDNCDRIVYDILYFDLRSLKDLFASQYKNSSGEVYLNINNPSMELFYPKPLYKF